MMTNKLWEPLNKMDLPEGGKVVTSTWACKKKSNDTYYGQLNARRFKLVAGKHFNPTSTAAPVTNDTTIRIVLVADWTARIYFIKGAFLKGKFEVREEIFMEVPQCIKHHHWDLAVPRLFKPIYGMKQAALLFW